MTRRGIDCLVLNGSSGRWNEMNANIRYIAGYADNLSGVGYQAHLDLARPGVSERELYTGIVHAMDAAGAEPPTFLLLSSGPMPGPDQQTGDPIPSNRILQPGDVISTETSPKWAGYQAQG